MSSSKGSSITGLGIRNTVKGGLRPKPKEGKSSEGSSITGLGIRNTVKGNLPFKGRDPNGTEAAKDHVSRPLAALKDPSAFGPPPKNVNYHGGAALPNQITPDRSGLGAPLTADQVQRKQEAADEQARLEEEESRRAAAPRMPYRADTTGLSTSHLPPPPGRKDGADGRIPAPNPKPKPGLPPRLPPRQNSNPGPNAPSPPPTYGATVQPPAHRGVMNQDSLNRLGASGISVPGFGIGGKPSISSPDKPSLPSRSATTSSASGNSPQLNELQSRFSRMAASPTPAADTVPQGTTFAQKQAALKAASSFRNDPSSVSISDARSAASTANNFRDRHGDQVATGWQSANKVNQKYGIADKVANYNTSQSHTESVVTPIEMRDNTVAVKKPPPPPPKKKPGLTGGADAGAGPPPVPLSSKPKPNVSNNINLPLQKSQFNG
jgi:hypothetical protein